ncbi:hypothetical protein VN97_g6505 [Penicillium thymicola]|uniref:Uncharacterized protein n=1 Tax=Penicillium thymicola TaxID=293382 RepID=A0AAI9X7P3_PENTH|nr:hypothetical protein VN97_g6505 [Penicillium thymicola]
MPRKLQALQCGSTFIDQTTDLLCCTQAVNEKKKEKEKEKFSGWSSAKGPFPSRFVVPMRKGGLYLGGTLVEDPLEELMVGMVMAQYGIVRHLPKPRQLHCASLLLSFYAITPRDGSV